MTVNNYMTSIIKIHFFLIYKLIKPRTKPEMYTLKSLGPILYQTLFLFLNNGNADYVYGYYNIFVVFWGFFLANLTLFQNNNDTHVYKICLQNKHFIKKLSDISSFNRIFP